MSRLPPPQLNTLPVTEILRKACELPYAATLLFENPICSHFPAEDRRYRPDKARRRADRSRQDKGQESSFEPLIVREGSEVVRAAGLKPPNETLPVCAEAYCVEKPVHSDQVRNIKDEDCDERNGGRYPDACSDATAVPRRNETDQPLCEDHRTEKGEQRIG